MGEIQSFNAAEFRRVLGTFPTGVCVITGQSGGRRLGITVGSFSSISLDPPLVGFFIDRASTRWPEIAQTGQFCVNVLASSQGEACNYFARRQNREFERFAVASSACGLPVIEDAVALIDCSIAGTQQIGDHDLIIGRVTSLKKTNEAPPLVFCQGALGEVTALSDQTHRLAVNQTDG